MWFDPRHRVGSWITWVRDIIAPAPVTGTLNDGLDWWDLPFLVMLASAAGLASYEGNCLIDPSVFWVENAGAWFGSEVPLVFSGITDRMSYQLSAWSHPLFGLVAFPVVQFIKVCFHLDSVASVRVFVAGCASLWMASLFVVLRLLTRRRLDSVVFSLLASTSAAAVFWLVLPETHLLGSVSLLLCLWVVAFSQQRHAPSSWYLLATAMSFSFVVTNGVSGIIAAFTRFHPRQAVGVIAKALVLVLVLWNIQSAVFPDWRSGFSLAGRPGEGSTMTAGTGDPHGSLSAFIFHPMVMSAIQEIGTEANPPNIRITHSGIGNGPDRPHILIWSLLLTIGVLGLLSTRQNTGLRIVLGLTILSQLALHAVRDGTCVYSLEYGPLLVLLAAFGVLTRARAPVLVLGTLLTGSAAIHNGKQFRNAVAHFSCSERRIVLQAMKQRPDDPWPRGIGHVLLGPPGSSETQKSYHEPGGSFSPSVGSFGISIWIANGDGTLMTTSDQIHLDQIRQRWEWGDSGTLPSILTETPYYESRWSRIDEGAWHLDLNWKLNGQRRAMLAVRSVGPAGGPIQSLSWNGRFLLINDRWKLAVGPQLPAVYLAEEGVSGWKTAYPATTSWKGKSGWGYVRIELPGTGRCTLSIFDLLDVPTQTSAMPAFRSSLEAELPDSRFEACLNSQVAQLLMSLVDGETRPGDPMNYPLAWQRDGAYVLAALARAGQIEVAKELSVSFTVDDFFGGFGAEADGPGLAIWALDEVAIRVREPGYDRWLWPHIQRKARLIQRMLDPFPADREMRYPVLSPIVPSLRYQTDNDFVCGVPREGLITGRMDHDVRLLYVNAVSFCGLQRAADLAERIGRSREARAWRASAAALRQSWVRAFKPPETDDPRTYISCLWPTWIGCSNTSDLLDNLRRRWVKRHGPDGGFVDHPAWTYFEAAEAHQWLFLGYPERTWDTLQWFWNHQASPGLYTWWEGNGEENSYHRWEKVRGWVQPPHVTPHYWTTAEILMLQFDMLAYTDLTGDRPILVIGAGIPREWLDHPMKVKGLLAHSGRVDWDWDGDRMHVQVSGDPCTVRLGPAFDAGTPVTIQMEGLK